MVTFFIIWLAYLSKKYIDNYTFFDFFYLVYQTKMHNKKAIVLCGYLWLLALAACWPKVVDDADVVSLDYELSFRDGAVIDQWNKTIAIWDSDSVWMETVVMWAKIDEEFEWTINGKEIFWSLYNENLTQSYPNIIITEVLWVSEPSVWSEVFVESFGSWFITEVSQDSEWYSLYTVNFNDPKTYSELLYSIKVTNIEKN